MDNYIFFEFLTNVNESKRIEGFLGIPGISRNGNLYLPSELAIQDGEPVPIDWDHVAKTLGQATLHWDEELQQLKIIFEEVWSLS